MVGGERAGGSTGGVIVGVGASGGINGGFIVGVGEPGRSILILCIRNRFQNCSSSEASRFFNLLAALSLSRTAPMLEETQSAAAMSAVESFMAS